MAQFSQIWYNNNENKQPFFSVLAKIMEGKPLQLLTKEEHQKEISSNLPELISNSDFILDYKLRILGLSPDTRKDFIEETLEALNNNNQSIGPFLISKKGTRLPPTASNWLKDFDEFVGSPINKAKVEEYLNSQDFKKIDVGPRTILNNLFEFYELLINYQNKPDQISRKVVKDESGKIKIIDKGEFVDFEKKEFTDKPPLSSSPIKSIPEEIKEVPLPSESNIKGHVIAPEKKEKVEDKIIPQKAIAASYLHPEDEEEIKNHENNLSGFSLPELSGAEAVIKNITELNNLSFPDNTLEKRFKLIASSFLKGIRNKRDTSELFTKPTNAGGLEYSENLAQKLIEELKQNENMMYAQKVMTQELPKSVPSPQQALEKALTEEKILKAAPNEESPPITGQQYAIPEPIKTSVSEEKTEKKEVAEIKRVKPEEEKFRIKRPIFSARRRVEDIKGKSKVMGPVDELNGMNLNDFQRLETEKISSVEKVYDKINLLKEDSFTKYAEGIKAWRNSEVYKLYLQLGAESMEGQKSIREIIQEKKREDLPCLTVSQFNNIADLNKKLRY